MDILGLAVSLFLESKYKYVEGAEWWNAAFAFMIRIPIQILCIFLLYKYTAIENAKAYAPKTKKTQLVPLSLPADIELAPINGSMELAPTSNDSGLKGLKG